MPDQTDLAQTLARIQSSRDTLPWMERQSLARRLGQELANGVRTDVVLQFVHVLAKDPKWEVRKETAELLLLLPDGDFLKIVAQLSNDDNAFVRNTAQKALDRRQQGRREPGRRQGMQNADCDFAALERLYGPKVAEAARKTSERMYDLLVGEVVHEMRGIVTSVKGNTTAVLAGLEEKKPDLKAVRTKMGRVRDRLMFLEQLLNDMRTYSQSLSTERRAERLADVAAEAHAMALERLEATEKGAIKAKVEIDVPETIVIEMARHQIVIALANVMKNGIEALAGQKNGWVKVNAAQADGQVTIRLENNGPGRDAEDLGALREFVPGRTTMKNKGTGFGLPISRKNVIAHGGQLELDSPGGRGFVVTIRLPLQQKDSTEA